MENWRLIQKKTFKTLESLIKYLEIDESNQKLLLQKKDFGVLVPYAIAKKIPKNCLKNPLSLQFLPHILENDKSGYKDPVGDNFAKRSNALLHKYKGRALLLTTSACAMHCRYCFRQNYDYRDDIDNAIDIIAKDRSIKEVILSGGDPLSLSDKRLKEILEKLDAIEHIKIIRFHTRFLVGIPERISENFLSILKGINKQIVFVVHINCVEEIDDAIIRAMRSLMQLKIPLMTQSVLMKGVNDNFDSLYQLFDMLSSNGIIPYYLHKLDNVTGSRHFFVEEKKGIDLILQLRDALPGYAVPRFVKEIAKMKSKTLIL